MNKKMKTACLLALSIILTLTMASCSPAPGSTSIKLPSSPLLSGFPTAGDPDDGAGTASPLASKTNKVVSFATEVDLDGDGIIEKIEEGRYPIEGYNQGDTFLNVTKGAEVFSYAFDEDEPRSFSEYAELADVDGDSAAEILIWRDLGSGFGPGQVLKFRDNSFVCIFDSGTAKPDIHVTYAAKYTLLVQSITMKPTQLKYPLQPGEKYGGVYDDQGKLLNTDLKCLVDPPSFMHSVKTKETSPAADIEIEQFCSGAGGHADGLGIIRTTYRYYAQGWKIVATTFEFTGQ